MTFSYNTQHTSYHHLSSHISAHTTHHTDSLQDEDHSHRLSPRWSQVQLWSTPLRMQECIRWYGRQRCGQLVRLHLIEKTHLVGREVKDNGTDGCQVCFSMQEYATADNAHVLDGSLLRITQVFLPDSENRSMRALYHRNCSCAYAETFKNWQDGKMKNN